jgi:Ser/Thr protein kinase RdoA (MazF antagonist)
VRFLADDAGLDGAVAPLRTHSGALEAEVVSADGSSGTTRVVVSVCPWAPGQPIDFAGLAWARDPGLVRAWGAWLARCHAASRAFSAAHPALAASLPRYDEVHDRTLAGAAVAADDAAVEGDPAHWGVLHGDANLSNLFVVNDDGPGSEARAAPRIAVIDWDQCQRGWWLADVAQAAIAAYMIAEAGFPPDGARPPLPIDPDAALAWMVEGYESESPAGAGSVDRARLHRMLDLRREFYRRFADRALAEGVPDAQMQSFLEYTQRWANPGPKDGAGMSNDASGSK